MDVGDKLRARFQLQLHKYIWPPEDRGGKEEGRRRKGEGRKGEREKGRRGKEFLIFYFLFSIFYLSFYLSICDFLLLQRRAVGRNG